MFIALFPRWFVARHAAAVTPMILPWLVGPARVIDAPDDLPVDDRGRPPANALDSLLASSSPCFQTAATATAARMPRMRRDRRPVTGRASCWSGAGC